MTRPITAVLLAVLFTACAGTSGPSDFRQAAMSPPRPPAVRPAVNDPYFPTPGATPQGAGAYRGEPLPTRPVPRSPNKRYVQPEKDGTPGLWAADGAPQAAASERRKVFGIEIPSGNTDEDRTVTAECSGALADVMERSPYWDGFIAQTPENVRRCMAARAFLFCAEGLNQQLKAGRLFHPYFGPNAIEPTTRRAAMMERSFCAGVELEGKQRATLEGVQRRWQTEELMARLRRLPPKGP